MVKSARRRQRKAAKAQEVDDDAPRIVIIRRGSLRPELKQLVRDLRVLVSPNCASRLNEGSHQKMKDFTEVSEALGLTHLLAVSETERGCYLKVANLPKGPTLTFAIDAMALVSDIAKSSSNPKSIGGACHFSPLVVLNGFSGAPGGRGRSSVDETATAMKTVATTLNGMFSPIDVSTVKMQNCKRVVLFDKDRKSDVIVMRHYLINLVDCNTSNAVQELIDKRSIKRLMQDKGASFKDVLRTATGGKLDVSNLNDDYVELNNVDHGDAILRHKYGLPGRSDLEEADDEANKLAVRLTEAGPRLNLRLIKVEAGVFSGGVSFHKFVSKTPEEIARLEALSAEKRRMEAEEAERKRRKAEGDDKGDAQEEESDEAEESDSD
ncbi:Brix domain containing protein, putative [Babesia bigemina]|uniref:Brix domain containing protein, putative n=1 Tax=Babesia bigemina TaxID=5866 RepID=A0A061DEC7_BABBI|nr:Brix domain containing protein, putative [Babesia bigemina]CDR97050.1 Brix domain containing protein, putative [Babesia bigemina]|eukprot:XP_012769236.1 Brix domain containing protein, putative [Babesia bigemina]